MNPRISIEMRDMQTGQLGEEASVPDLIGGLILQNRLQFQLDEEDEIYEGYGRRANSYPYRQYSCYSRELKRRSVKTAILENDYLKAVFLPEFGGRLWSLWDKEKEQNLLYTNDVIRFSNLAVRNAWFSGGAEWNIGIIGHSPFTASPLFAGTLEDERGIPVLRMYEYERIREVTYQMDFWLGKHDRFLNARMRVVNTGSEVVPMYWWSNIAVPEHEGGRIIVPAKKAYTSKNRIVYKTDIPMVNGVDITKYKNIPSSVDYFFEIPKEAPKYIAHIDDMGYGLLHLSTNRLQSRKLFSWGQKQGSDHWQDFLTEKAGRYVEIQAGLGKTQYGCLPMAPHTAWEWLERYGAVCLEEKEQKNSFAQLREKVTKQVLGMPAYQEMESVLKDTKKLAKKSAVLFQKGSGYGALKNAARKCEGGSKVSRHLDFGECEEQQRIWEKFLLTGNLAQMNPSSRPPDFLSDEILVQKLADTITGINSGNWYAHYQLGLSYLQNKDYERAKASLLKSLELEENPWSYHGMASLYTITEEKEKAIEAIHSGLRMRKKDLSYLKEGFRILSLCGGFREMIAIYRDLDSRHQKDGRLKFYYIQALAQCNELQKAYDLLYENGGLIIDDIREGEKAVEEIWKQLSQKLYGQDVPIPYRFDFTSV